MTTSRQTAPVDIRKFQFDEFERDDLPDRLNGLAETELAETTYSQEELDAATAAGEEAGYERGVAETRASIEADIAHLLAQIAQSADIMLAEQRNAQETIGAEAIRLAALVARKVLPAMAESGALQEIEALISRCLSERPEEPRLVVRIHDAMLDKIEARLATITTETGFMGRPVLLADPSLRRTEIRIEWANGGVDWSFDKQLAVIETAGHKLAAKTTTAKLPPSAHDDSPMSEEISEDILDVDPSKTEDAGA